MDIKNLNTLRSVNLNLLVVFHELLLEGSVSRAANKLGISQPAVSHALARLR
ncbi:MAG: LysR family transcriptional regulator, partial [Desulfobacterales bacterium]|nr:LysR family transcriptional regulator [Desulfobacterales bacterium]